MSNLSNISVSDEKFNKIAINMPNMSDKIIQRFKFNKPDNLIQPVAEINVTKPDIDDKVELINDINPIKLIDIVKNEQHVLSDIDDTKNNSVPFASLLNKNNKTVTFFLKDKFFDYEQLLIDLKSNIDKKHLCLIVICIVIVGSYISWSIYNNYKKKHSHKKKNIKKH